MPGRFSPRSCDTSPPSVSLVICLLIIAARIVFVEIRAQGAKGRLIPDRVCLLEPTPMKVVITDNSGIQVTTVSTEVQHR